MGKLKTGLAIIHYNDYESLVNLISNTKDYKVLDRIMIYDNHSELKIQEKIKKLENNKVKVVIAKENLGYSHAINEASKKLVQELGECNIIISNSDIVILKEEDINTLISSLLKKEVGVVAPTVLENNHLNRGWKEISPLLDSLLNIVFIHRMIRKKYVFYKEEHYQGDNSYVDVASGCFFLIQSKTLEKIHYLDENLFLYYEENVLAKKIKNIGLKILIRNDILIKHNHSVSIDKNMKKIAKLKVLKKSQYYFHKEYNQANILERLFLKITAFTSRQILKVAYWAKDLGG